MRALVLVTLLLAGCSTTTVVVEFRPNADLVAVQAAVDSSVKIACMRDNGMVICTGSGTVVSSRKVITARHLFNEKPYEIIVQTSGAKRSTLAFIESMGESDEDDWAVLRTVDTLARPSGRLDNEKVWSKPVFGERVVVVGYALGFVEPTVTDGRYCGAEDSPYFYRISADTIYGNSGGGMFVWRNQKLVLAGVMSRLAISHGQAITHMAWATRIDLVK